MTGAVSFFGITVNDNTVKDNGTPERGQFEVAITTLDETNFTDQEALGVAFQTAVDNITLGVLARSTLVAVRGAMSDVAAASKNAQRENKWLCRYHSVEAVSKKFSVSIPTADLSLVVDHKEYMDLTAGVGLALKNAWAAFVMSPDDSDVATVLDSVYFVGRAT